MRSGSVPSGYEHLIPEHLAPYYQDGTLFVTELDGVTQWVVRSFGTYYLGGVVGPLLLDAVIAHFTSQVPTPAEWWA